MVKNTKLWLAWAALAVVPACAELNRLNIELGGRDLLSKASSPLTAQGSERSDVPANTPEAFDQTTDVEREAAIRAPKAGRSLGKTVASLGNPSEPGFWLKTPLVQAETAGQITNPKTGNSVAVRLIPIDGPATAGSRLSLAAMRLLNVNLADLVSLEVRR